MGSIGSKRGLNVLGHGLMVWVIRLIKCARIYDYRKVPDRIFIAGRHAREFPTLNFQFYDKKMSLSIVKFNLTISYCKNKKYIRLQTFCSRSMIRGIQY
jgi:hypothetical protein